jgi:ABC-type uncharacterized transport system substrate-binding protein
MGLDTTAFRVGLLMSIPPDRPQIKGLRDGLKEAGYIEESNLELQMPLCDTVDQLQAVARSYRGSKINVIVTTGGVETRVAKNFAGGVFTVFMPVTDPVNSGFVKSLSHPGTTMTGIAFTGDIREHGKQFQIFKQIVPSLRGVAVLYDKRHPAAAASLGEMRKVATYLKTSTFEIPVKSIAEARNKLSSLDGTMVNGVFLICSSLFADPTELGILAKKKKLAFHSCTIDHVEKGITLFAYARDFYAIGRRGAWYVDRILKGAKPEDLPVESPMKFELVINLQTAREIGILIPSQMLQQADKVIR